MVSWPGLIRRPESRGIPDLLQERIDPGPDSAQNSLPMLKRILKWTLRILALLVILLAVFLINLIWFRPWSLNLFYEKIFAQVLFE